MRGNSMIYDHDIIIINVKFELNVFLSKFNEFWLHIFLYDSNILLF